MGGSPAGGGGVTYQVSSTPNKPKPERKKVPEAATRSRYAGAMSRKEEEAGMARKKLLTGE